VGKDQIIRDNRKLGPDYFYPAWKPVTFHMNARVETGQVAAEPGKASADGHPALVQLRRLGPDLIDPLIKEYNSSGNPGQFQAIYDGDYAHIVPTATLQGGSLVEFQPVLSTVVPMSGQDGTRAQTP
jgi:hypothetical protein